MCITLYTVTVTYALYSDVAVTVTDTYIFGIRVMVRAERLIAGLLVHIPEDQSRNGEHEDEHPEHGEDAQHVSPAPEETSALWSQHGHQPVHTHERNEHDGGIHVGVAQIEEQLAHGASEHPRLFGQVHDEEHSQAHDGTIGTRQVQDDQCCD